MTNSPLIAIIGLGYVGLPLAIEFGKIRPVIGFDTNQQRISELQGGFDHTREVEPDEFAAAAHLNFTADEAALRDAHIFIVTVPTPVDDAKRPDVSLLIKASQTVGAALRRGGIVIFESTVFPGCTEEVCVPVLERMSGLKFNVDFSCGYSPERINPGDKEHRLPTILKVTSGSDDQTAEAVDALYRQIITAGTYRASSIKVAEAAKVIENTQRDVNIALMNELSLIFHRLEIDTTEVLEAAGTKWNFLPFRPGLVGGHCIGVDPYYLTHKAQQVGYHPEVILSGRKINDQMGSFVAESTIKLMLAKGIQLLGSKVLMMGLSFKENCPDIRNTRAIDIVAALKDFSIDVEVYDPWVSPEEAMHEYGLVCSANQPEQGRYDAIVVAVGHREFTHMGAAGIRNLGKGNSVIFDVKSIFSRTEIDGRL
jgi:UDP-N-acetyl-D-glucosamine/UDP-N-acetyl-D-galactosamine dehydrogenase